MENEKSRPDDHASAQPPIRQQTLDALGPEFVEDVGRYVVPIFRDRRGKPESFGTGFLLYTGRDHVLVTAAHVLDGIKTGATYYFYAAPRLKRPVAGRLLIAKLRATGNRRDDLIDVAAMVLADEDGGLPPFPLIGKDSMPVTRVAPHASPRVERRYAFLGFPSSRGKVNPVAKNVRSAAYAYLSASASSDVYERMELNERDHVVLPFSKRNVVTLDGKPFNFPKVDGMSGSPLWELRRPEDGGRRVVGVMIENRQRRDNLLVAADIGFVVGFLADHYHEQVAGTGLKEQGL